MIRNAVLQWPLTQEDERRDSPWEEDWIDLGGEG